MNIYIHACRAMSEVRAQQILFFVFFTTNFASLLQYVYVKNTSFSCEYVYLFDG